jgi:imidazolonepropionase
MSLAIKNIGSLITNDPELENGLLGELTNVAIQIEDNKIAWIGPTAKLGATDEVIDAQGLAVIPGFVDSHAHLLFAGDRSKEFEARMQGRKYSAGGIHSTVAATRSATDQDLRGNLLRLEKEMLRSGITTFETKSGYGLNLKDEKRSLEIAAERTQETTFLGAHVVPKEFEGRADDYVELVKGEMLDAIEAKWIDVFCDQGAFSVDQAREILLAGIGKGMQPRIHANQLTQSGGVELAIELDCASADHCTHLSDDQIEALAASNTVATLLPGAEFSTRSPYPDARRFFSSGAAVAIATDCNPGSSYTTDMPFCIAVAIREMHFTPEQALFAATAGGAKALRRSDVGVAKIGAKADLVLLDAPSYLHLGYRPGVNIVSKVISNSQISYEGTK